MFCHADVVCLCHGCIHVIQNICIHIRSEADELIQR